ncbi:MAG: hypothetical protein K8R23_19090 [Chthoniobacter sp.]|nr:hypothetical protein [Chthoniobacter sp.]
MLGWIVVLATGSIRRWMAALAAASAALVCWALALAVMDLRRFSAIIGRAGLGDPVQAAASVGNALVELSSAGLAGTVLLFLAAIGVWLWSRPALPPPLGPQP